MRGLGVSLLVVGFLLQCMVGGQVFDSALGGIVLGLFATLCGAVSTRTDYRNHGSGWMIATAGMALALWRLTLLPSAYEDQQKFNNPKQQFQESIIQPGGMQGMPYISVH